MQNSTSINYIIRHFISLCLEWHNYPNYVYTFFLKYAVYKTILENSSYIEANKNTDKKLKSVIKYMLAADSQNGVYTWPQ